MASDVDGTLLDSAESVSSRTRAAVHGVITSGTPFVLVTGRPPRWIPSVAAAAGLDGYAVCANGAVVYDISADRVLAVRGMDPVLLHDVAAAVDRAIPGCTLATERIGASAYDPAVMPFFTEPGYRHPWDNDDPTTQPRAEVLGHEAVKLLIRHEKMTSDEMAVAAKAVLGGTMGVTFSSGVGLLEISAPGVSKATGLRWVAQRLGVAADDVLAFGDMPNDIPMLRWAGHGVAMANAHPEVRAVADEITAANIADGVACVLERWW